MSKKTHISFVEEMVLNPQYYGYIAGRMEIHRPEDRGFASDEKRFFTKKIGQFNSFRNKWDLKEVTEKELKTIEDLLESKFYELDNL